MTTLTTTPQGSPRRILLITGDLGGYGGIQKYARWVAQAVGMHYDLSIADVSLDGSRKSQGLAFLEGMRAVLRHRPQLVVFSHVALAPIGMTGRLFGCRYVVIAHGIEIWGPRSFLTDVALRLAACAWPNSSFTREELLRLYPSSRAADPLGGGLEPEQFDAASGGGSVFRILTVSRLDDLHYKGIDTTLAVVARLRRAGAPVEFVIVGSGPQAEQLGEVAADPVFEGHVRVLGMLSEHALAETYRSSDVVVLVSRHRAGAGAMGEGLGLTLLEGAARGLPVIGAREGGSVDAVRDGDTGFLVDAGDQEMLFERLAWMIAHRREAAEMGERGREWVRAVHGRDAFTQRVRDAVRVAMQDDGGGGGRTRAGRLPARRMREIA